MSRQELADAVNAYLWTAHRVRERLDEKDIGKLERGENRWLAKLRREAFRAVLQVEADAETGFYIIRGAADENDIAAVLPSLADPESVANVNGLGERRRVLLSGVAMIAAASGLFGGSGWAGQRRVGSADVARLNALTMLYRSMDYEYGGGVLVTDVGKFAESASALLDLSYSDSLAPALHSSIAAARHLAGWTAFDAGRHSDAQRHLLRRC
jgi:hypothetical protein